MRTIRRKPLYIARRTVWTIRRKLLWSITLHVGQWELSEENHFILHVERCELSEENYFEVLHCMSDNENYPKKTTLYCTLNGVNYSKKTTLKYYIVCRSVGTLRRKLFWSYLFCFFYQYFFHINFGYVSLQLLRRLLLWLLIKNRLKMTNSSPLDSNPNIFFFFFFLEQLVLPW